MRTGKSVGTRAALSHSFHGFVVSFCAFILFSLQTGRLIAVYIWDRYVCFRSSSLFQESQRDSIIYLIVNYIHNFLKSHEVRNLIAKITTALFQISCFPQIVLPSNS